MIKWHSQAIKQVSYLIYCHKEIKRCDHETLTEVAEYILYKCKYDMLYESDWWAGSHVDMKAQWYWTKIPDHPFIVINLLISTLLATIKMKV